MTLHERTLSVHERTLLVREQTLLVRESPKQKLLRLKSKLRWRCNVTSTLVEAGAGLALLLFFTGCQPCHDPKIPVTVSPKKGRIFETTCAACHGEKGEGNRELGAPSIASLPAWYVKIQFEKFRNGQRGAHPQDFHGQQMRAVAQLVDDADIAEAAAAVEKMPRILTTSTDPNPPESLARAKKIFADSCMACHRFNGSGERVFNSAPLVGLPDWYHAAQMKKFRDGLRGRHPQDFYGQKMVDVASRFDDEMIREMAAYLAALAQGDDPREVMDR